LHDTSSVYLWLTLHRVVTLTKFGSIKFIIYVHVYVHMCVRIYVYVCMYIKNLRFHLWKYYVCTHVHVLICVCIYLQGTSVKGRSHFLCGNFSDILFTCVFYMHASRIWRRHEWIRKGCARLCINSLFISKILKKTLLFRHSLNLCVSLNKHTLIITQTALANYSFNEQGMFSP
jgi:hypothetical protein